MACSHLARRPASASWPQQPRPRRRQPTTTTTTILPQTTTIPTMRKQLCPSTTLVMSRGMGQRWSVGDLTAKTSTTGKEKRLQQEFANLVSFHQSVYYSLLLHISMDRNFETRALIIVRR